MCPFQGEVWFSVHCGTKELSCEHESPLGSLCHVRVRVSLVSIYEYYHVSDLQYASVKEDSVKILATGTLIAQVVLSSESSLALRTM